MPIRPHHQDEIQYAKHHLSQINEVDAFGSNPLREHCRGEVRLMYNNQTIDDDYKVDVVGPQQSPFLPDGFTNFWGAKYAFLLCLAALPDAHPVTLSHKPKDLLCSGCISGKHCFEDTLNPIARTNENSFVDDFAQRCKARSIPVTVQQETVRGIAGFKCIDTKVGIVREVYDIEHNKNLLD